MNKIYSWLCKLTAVFVIPSEASESAAAKTIHKLPADYDPEKSGQAVATLLVMTSPW
ncbi:hypothetical protein ACFL4T_05990 [candidate division KSB1 bacterium]